MEVIPPHDFGGLDRRASTGPLGRLTAVLRVRHGSARQIRYKGPMSRFMPPLAVLRASAWFCLALIAFLSLIPREMEARTGLLGEVEHLIAYAGTAGLLRLSYPSWAGWRVVVAFFVYACCLELLQGFVSGREPGLNGALASGAGAIIGVIAATLIGRRAQQKAN
jgi:VanZ family protein